MLFYFGHPVLPSMYLYLITHICYISSHDIWNAKPLELLEALIPKLSYIIKVSELEPKTN